MHCKSRNPLIINAALTGMVPTRADTPFIPLTPEEIIKDALRCIEEGASILHLHARDEDGLPTHRKEVYARVIEGIRSQCPEALLCVSTSGRNVPEFAKRSEVLALEGDSKPDMASLTMGSFNFPQQASVNSPQTVIQLASMMQEKGIIPEIEIFDSGMINGLHYLAKKEYLQPPFYCNIIVGSLYGAQANLEELLHLTRLLPDNTLWSCGGIGEYQLQANSSALLMGGHVRVGLEDNLWYDTGKKVLATNVTLIQRVVRIAEELERAIATPEEVRNMLRRPCPLSVP